MVSSDSSSLPRVFLVPGGDRRLKRGHPWVYSNEVRMDEATRALPAGGLATLHRTDGKGLGVGTFNPHCLIAFRLFSHDAGAVVDEAFIAARLGRALDLRRRLFAKPYYRLVHGEADGLPGLVIDRFDRVIVVQTATAGMEALLQTVLGALEAACAPETVVLANRGAFRRLEELDDEVRLAKGELDGPIEVHEGELRFLADPLGGQKTGWFYDQRDSRAFVANLAPGGRVLDVYCYTGAFALAAAVAGAAEVLAIDRSPAALELGRRAAELNGVAEKCRFAEGEAFAELERLAGESRRFDVVVADPPAFVKSRKEVKSGLKGYRKLARLAAALVEPGGFLFVASCSHNVDAESFAGEVATGLARAGRGGRIVRAAGAGADHPLHPGLPESAYLTSLVLQLD